MPTDVSKEQQIKDLKTRLNVLGEVVKQLEEKNMHLANKIMLLNIEKSQWSMEKIKQGNIISQALQTVNATNNQYLEENEKLKTRIRELGG